MSYTIRATEIKLGACKIWYWDTNGWVPVGATTEGVSISYSPKFFDLTIDQLGTTVVKKVLQGEEAKINFTIAERGLAKLQLAIPFGTIYQSGGSQAMGVGSNPGGDLLDHTVKLKLHPINNLGTSGVDDESFIDDDIMIWDAGNADSVELPYMVDKARTYKVSMTLFPDFDQTAGRYLFVIGDTSISADSTAPTVQASNPAAGGSGVAITASIVALTSEPIRELEEDEPNAIVKLVKDSDFSNVAGAVSSEKYVEGTASAGTSTTMTLEAGDVFADDCMNGLYAEITGGTGQSPTLVAITDSDTGDNSITVAAWPNGTPDSTSTYRIHTTRITFDPTASLDNSTAYDLVVSNMVDLAGNVQTNVDIRQFTTVAP